MPLNEAKKGEPVLVVRVAADGNTRRHLENLGIMSGAELTPLAEDGGNMILRVFDSRIALNSAVAQSIIVRKRPVFA